MQEERIAQLQTLIMSSSVLTASEKTEWVHSLPVMNDKQLVDLEMILKTHPPTSSLAPVQNPAIPAPQKPGGFSKPPSLSHIANLPAFMGQPRQPVEEKPTTNTVPKKPTVPWEQKLEHMIQEKELPAAPKHKPIASPEAKPTTPVAPQVQRKTPFAVPTLTQKPFPKQPFVQPTHTHDDFWAQVGSRPSMLNKKEDKPEPDVHLLRKVEQPVQTVFENPSDVEKMGKESLTSIPWEALITTLQKLVRQHGFIAIQFALEKSPLYQAYVSVGHTLLEKNMTHEQYAQSNKPELTKDEFEKVADLLRKIQVN